ncbi:MAG: hypothetical protein JWO86_2024 [Myxococcaceae bacterium]|nr:hypothetical protein [Myxococcaceae bacterium]
MSASRQASGVLAGTVALLFAREASASESAAASASARGTTATARWYVETTGASCKAERSAFEHEIQLACDAVGGSCGVAAAPTDAGLRAVLDCSGGDDAWSLVTRTSGGTVLATLDLSGPHDDRLREAAVEVARDATPERSLAIETLRFSISGEQPEPPTKRPAQTLGLAVSGSVSSGTDKALPAMLGGRLLAGLEVARSIRATLGFGAEAGGSGIGAARAVRGGVGIALGAPFDPNAPVGFAVEGGLSATSDYPPSPISDSRLLPATTSTGVYGQGSFIVQIPIGSIRPFAALSADALSAPVHVGVSGQLGVAFPLF